MIFQDRVEAGRVLAQKLQHYKGRPDVIVLGLPRGGVPVAYELAQALNAPMDVFLVRKLGVPGHEELAMGAIASGGVRLLNEDVVRELDIPQRVIDASTVREEQELLRRQRLYRGERPAPDLGGKIVIVADDGLATGSTMRVALAALRQQHPAKLIVAVPVGPAETCESLAAQADELVCPETPEPFFSVGAWYFHFDQTTDNEVRDLLERSARGR